jgi:hypothetical protein
LTLIGKKFTIYKNEVCMRDRSPEELDAILQSFPDVFENEMGKPINPELVEKVLGDLLAERELNLIKQRFFDFSPANLREVIQRIKTKPQPELIEAIEPIEPKKRGRHKK